MDNKFDGHADNKKLSMIFKREANIILASLDSKSEEYKNKLKKFDIIFNIVKTIEDYKVENSEDVVSIINTVVRICTTGILSPLTLNKDEFNDVESFDIYVNKRYPYIYSTKDNKIYNSAAYRLCVRAIYDNVSSSQIETNNYSLPLGNPYVSIPIYISKGGVITGEYIKLCEIRKDIIEKHSFTIQSIVNIPVSKITDNDITIYAVDHREPKLKVLKEFYEVPVCIDDNIKNKHYNIRKYKKLNK